MSFWENTRKPEGLGGKITVSMMNLCHSPISRWGLSFLKLPAAARVLDCGCGGGANLKRLLKQCPEGTVKGIDYAPVSVQKSQKLNADAIMAGRCSVLQGNVADMLFASDWFDAVTAFETVYFWPELSKSFREIRRVLKPGGTFCVCNACSGSSAQDEKWAAKIPGMTVYREEQLRAVLEEAGFSSVESHKNKQGWICILARK